MRVKSGYLIHEFENGKYAICKIINEVDNKDAALEVLLNLLNGSMTEQEIQSKYLKKIGTTLK